MGLSATMCRLLCKKKRERQAKKEAEKEANTRIESKTSIKLWGKKMMHKAVNALIVIGSKRNIGV